MSTSHSFFQCWPFSRTVHDRLSPPTVPKVLFAHISTSNYFWFVCLHQVTIITKFNYILLFWRTSQIFYYYYTICSNTTIITQYAQILLLIHNMLKYYYHHCTARQIHKDQRGCARRRTWWTTICQGTGLWGVDSYIQLAQVMRFRVLYI